MSIALLYQSFGIRGYQQIRIEFNAGVTRYRNKARVLVKRHLSRRSQNSYVNWTHLNRLCDGHPLANPSKLTDLIALSHAKVSGV